MIFNSLWRLKIGNMSIPEEHGSYFYFLKFIFPESVENTDRVVLGLFLN